MESPVMDVSPLLLPAPFFSLFAFPFTHTHTHTLFMCPALTIRHHRTPVLSAAFESGGDKVIAPFGRRITPRRDRT